MKTWHYIGILFVAVWCIAGPMAGYYYRGKACPALPTIQEIQTRIGCTKIDGKLGPGWQRSETQRLWDAALCDGYWLALADEL